MINVPELRKTLEFITAHPEKHEQEVWTRPDYDAIVQGGYDVISSSDVFGAFGDHKYHVATEETVWSCGTVGCLAGWAAMSHGWRPVTDSFSVYKDGKILPAEYAAKEVLGLNDPQRGMMFSGNNTLHDLWLLANVFTNGEIEIPEHVKPSTHDRWWKPESVRAYYNQFYGSEVIRYDQCS